MPKENHDPNVATATLFDVELAALVAELQPSIREQALRHRQCSTAIPNSVPDPAPKHPPFIRRNCSLLNGSELRLGHSKQTNRDRPIVAKVIQSSM